MEALPIIVPFFGAIFLYTTCGLCHIRRSYRQQIEYLGERVHALELKIQQTRVQPPSEINLDPLPVQHTVIPVPINNNIPIYTTPIYPQYNTTPIYPPQSYMTSQQPYRQ